MLLTELFNTKTTFKVITDSDTEFATYIKLTDIMGFRANKLGSTGNYWSCDFGRMRPNGSLIFGLTNNHDAVKVLAFVTESMSKFLKKHQPTKFKLEAHDKRASVYRRMLAKLLPDYDVKELEYEESSKFIMTRKQVDSAVSTTTAQK